MSEQKRTLPENFIELCDRRSRKAICAYAWNDRTKRDEIIGFRFHPSIADWPVCKQAESEGWGKELRAAMIATLSRAMRAGDNPELRDVIPRPDWIEMTRNNAERYRLAAEWRDGNEAAKGKRSSFFNLSPTSIRMTGEHLE